MTREEAASVIEDCVSLAEYVESSYVDCVDIEALKMAIEALRQPEQRWIPCSERLPEYGESVLCYFGTDEDFGVNHIIDEEDGEWFINGVTAWMPLPKPYGEKKE